MRLLLGWIVAQFLGGAGFLLLGIRDSYRAAVQVEFGWSTLIFYSDRLVWFGVTTAGFAVFDFVRRATNAREQSACTGAMFAWLVTFSVLILLMLAASYGMILMAGAEEIIEKVELPLVDGYGATLIAGGLISLVYVLGVEARMARQRGGNA